MQPIRITLAQGIPTAGLALLLTACLDSGTSPTKRTSPEPVHPSAGNGPFPNNSDPAKADYVPLLHTPGYDKEYLENLWDRSAGKPPAAGGTTAKALPKTASDPKYHGVIPVNNDCADPAARAWFYMDDEDSDNRSKIVWASGTLPWGINDGNAGNTRIRLCKVNASLFQRMPRFWGQPEGSSDYALITFGDESCPNGGYSFWKHISNERSNNNNSNSGMAQSYQLYSATWLYMCFYPDLPTEEYDRLFPRAIHLGGLGDQPYAVFARHGSTGAFLSKGYVYSDDADDSNLNSMNFTNTASAVWTEDLKARAKAILPLASNSTFNIRGAWSP